MDDTDNVPQGERSSRNAAARRLLVTIGAAGGGFAFGWLYSVTIGCQSG